MLPRSRDEPRENWCRKDRFVLMKMNQKNGMIQCRYMDHGTGPDNENPWFASPRSKHTDVLRGIGRLVDTLSRRGITASWLVEWVEGVSPDLFFLPSGNMYVWIRRNQSSNKRNCVMSPNLAFGYVKLGTRYRSYSTVMLSMDGKRKYSYIQYPSFLPGTRYNYN